ncbi:MAG: HAMP domain-containing sensor histidine kinase [Hyphomicrobiaceae bacterium]|nr:HAMP domain-containing sensor histidine kinase [Hyphomicrobiaceae bacterium]
MRPGSLRLRLIAGAIAFILAALAAAAAGLSVLFDRHVRDWVDAELAVDLDRLVAGLERGADGRLTLVHPLGDPRYARPQSGLYWQVMPPMPADVLRSRSLWDFSITLPDAAVIDDRTNRHRVSGPGGQSLYVLERRLTMPARLGSPVVRFAVAIDEATLEAAQWRFASAIVPFLALLGLLLAAAAWAQVSLGLAPLAGVQRAIADIRQGRRTRLGADFPEEIQPLSQEIDTLLAARERQLETARARAADLAHGLGTPLQVVFGVIDRLKAAGNVEIAGDLTSAANRMQRHIERQLARARLAAGRSDSRADVARIVGEIAAVVSRTAMGARLDWRCDVEPSLTAVIDADDLAEALGGMAENAARHAASRVTITAAAEGSDRIAIRIADDGPGMSAEDAERALARGARLDTTTPGTGLGLAIVADIAEAWGGTITFEHLDGDFCAVLRLDRPG